MLTIVSIFSLVFAHFLIRKVNQALSGSEKIIEISSFIREEATAFLKRQCKTISLVAVPLFFILWVVFCFKVGIGFLIGAIASVLAGFLGMMISTEANSKVAEAAKKGLEPAFNLSFKRGQ